eukprot:gene36160-43857_t
MPSLISIAYVGSFDPHQETKSLWTNTFATLLDSSGLGAKIPAVSKALSLVARNVVEFILSLSWERRKQSIAIIRDLLVSFPDSALEGIVGSFIAALLSQLKSVPWVGQEQALECIAEIVGKMPNHVQFHSAHPGGILDLSSLLSVSFSSVQDFLSKGSSDLQSQLEAILAGNVSSEAFLDNQSWIFFPLGFTEIIYHEFERKDNDFKFSAARSLSLIPWSKASTASCDIFSGIMVKLITKACLNPRPIAVVGEDSKPSAASPVVAPAATVVPSVAAKRTMGNNALFGNRYGSAPPPARPMKRPASAAVVEAPQTPAMPGTNADAGKQADRNIIAGRPASMDAAVRMFLVETMTSAWPSYVIASSGIQEHLTSTADKLFLWMDECFAEEVWSVRKATVKLLGTIATHQQLPQSSLAHFLSLLQKAFQEPKYTKVRLEVLEALRLIVTGVNRLALKADQEERIRDFVRLGATDTQPSILEAASKLQHQLLNF